MYSENSITNILIADSQFLIVEALKSLFSKEQKYVVYGVVETKFELRKALNEMGEGLLIVDFWSVDFTEIEEIKSFIEKYKDLHILILTNTINKSDFMELTKVGFKNIIYKTADKEELCSAIDSALKGKKYYSSLLLDMILETNSVKHSLEESKNLTFSEMEIVKMISQGFTTKEIAFRKNISFHTVNTHRKNIFRKLCVTNVSELVMCAIKSGWIDNIEYYI